MEESTLDRRLRQLDEAREHMLQAKKLVEDALHMSGMELWAERGILPAIDAWTDGVEEHSSIANLKRELEYKSGSDPIWTRPLVSVKHINRRDI